MAVTRTLDQPLRHEIAKIKGSRFIASAEPVQSIDDAESFLVKQRKEFYDATHNCFAWRVGDARLPDRQERFRASDDGEPSGTAGKPILQEIDGRELTDLVVVVTRYYGGTKLGTGGLIRAYSQAAAEVLDLATIREIPIVDPLVLIYDYARTGDVQSVLSSFGIKPGRAEYGESVQLRVAVPIEDTERLQKALVDATAGRIAWEPSESSS